MKKTKLLSDLNTEKINDDTSSNSNDDENGFTKGSTFLCSFCNNFVLIENDNCSGGDRNDCIICDLPMCNNNKCSVKCLHCENANICKKCSYKCDGCKGDICNNEECNEMTKKCKKCKVMYCDSCSNLKCKCKK